MPLIDYFIAADDTDAARVEPGFGGPEAYGFRTLPAKGVDPCVTLANLESILTERPHDRVIADPRQCHPVRDPDPDPEALVVTVTDSLRDALAAAEPPRLREAADAWARTDEMAGVAPQTLVDFLDEFRTLARTAAGAGHRLYCWLAL
jgi:hypothetical protein